MKFRKARLSDAKELSKLRRGVFGKIKGEEYLPTFVKALSDANSPKDIRLKIKSYDIFCLLDKKQIIGMVGLNGAEIKGVFVKVSHVRKGIGTKLMNFIEEHARKKGLKKVYLWSAEKANGFYKKRGYKFIKKVAKPYHGIKNVNFVMEKKL